MMTTAIKRRERGCSTGPVLMGDADNASQSPLANECTGRLALPPNAGKRYISKRRRMFLARFSLPLRGDTRKGVGLAGHGSPGFLLGNRRADAIGKPGFGGIALVPRLPRIHL